MIQGKIYALTLMGCQLLASAAARAETTDLYELDPLPVTGDLLNSSSASIPASVSLLGADLLQLPDKRHFGDIMGFLPNLNWAGGTSRPRYFQIRGIGENSQFGNEIPASSVGFVIDGIDFTGIGGVASLFDISKVEVLRGPQAAAFGANAMAGMILLETRPATGPEETFTEGTLGSDGLISAGLSSGGPVNDTLAYRVSVHRYGNNGFRNNTYLQRDDTNAKDEWSSQLKINWNPGSSLSFDLNVMYFDFNNGYDAWALDNDSFNTSTDEPGQDLQTTLATGITVNWRVAENLDLNYIGSVTDSEILYSYDWDWSNPDELVLRYGDEVYWGTDITERTRDVWSHDLRLQSGSIDRGGLSWVTGLYHRDFQEEQSYFGMESDYDTSTTAFYGQVRLELSETCSLTAGGRIESHSIDYDSLDPQAVNPGQNSLIGDNETLWGGKLAVEYRPAGRTMLYLSIDRGYKAGGINLDDEVPQAFRIYGSENLLNYELGLKTFLDQGRFWLNTSIFHMDRKDIQVDASVQLGDGNTFALYKDNAASGENSGIEVEANWRPIETLRLFASAGLLETEFTEYNYIDPANPSRVVDLAGKEQAYAPSCTYVIGFDYNSERGWFAGAAMEGKDGYVFDVVNEQQLKAYNLLRMHLGYRVDGWTVTLWARNLLDEKYDVRGFYFANEPPYYDTPRKWVSQGDPRQLGITVNLRF